MKEKDRNGNRRTTKKRKKRTSKRTENKESKSKIENKERMYEVRKSEVASFGTRRRPRSRRLDNDMTERPRPPSYLLTREGGAEGGRGERTRTEKRE